MSTYRIGNQTVNDDDPRLNGMLAAIHGSKQRPFCMCLNPGIEMYVAKISGKFFVKRMPDTGGSHAVSCDSYEPPQELSGLGQVAGTAIVENPDQGTTALKLDFSLTKSGSRAAPVKGAGESDTVKTEGTKLTLRGTLHYLWEQAGFHKWAPSMQGKRSWYTIRKFLMHAAENKTAKGTGLADILYIPETFSMEKKDQLAQQRTAQMLKIATPKNGASRLMILVGEVKEIAPSRYGHKIICKHMPDYHFMLNDDIHKRLRKRFENELALWDAIEGTHLMVIGTFSVGVTGVASIEEAALMTVTENWIPFEHTFEKMVLDKLTVENRRFFKGMRYNLASNRPLASAVLSDTEQPVAMYVLPPTASDEYAGALNNLIEESKLQAWVWKAGSDEMPALPHPSTAF